eukprot:550908-Rhodomonas_salina.1
MLGGIETWELVLLGAQPVRAVSGLGQLRHRHVRNDEIVRMPDLDRGDESLLPDTDSDGLEFDRVVAFFRDGPSLLSADKDHSSLSRPGTLPGTAARFR